MAKYGFTNVSGGGGVGSDELTTTAAHVLSGEKYVGKDTNDEIGIGTMPRQNAYTNYKSLGNSPPSKSLYARVPEGAYLDKTGVGSPEIVIPYSAVVNAAGMKSGDIMKGHTVLDVQGTATSDATANANQILKNSTAYVNGQKLTGTVEYQNPNVAGTDQVWATNTTAWNSGDLFFGVRDKHYMNGVSWIRAHDADFIAANIKKGVNIFGITGTHSGYVPSSTDLYLRGNNIAGFRSRDTGLLSLEAGQISIKTDSSCVMDADQISLVGYNYFNIQGESTQMYGYDAFHTIDFNRRNPDEGIATFNKYFDKGTYTYSMDISKNQILADVTLQFYRLRGTVLRIWLS